MILGGLSFSIFTNKNSQGRKLRAKKIPSCGNSALYGYLLQNFGYAHGAEKINSAILDHQKKHILLKTSLDQSKSHYSL